MLYLEEISPTEAITLESNCQIKPTSYHQFYNGDCWQIMETLKDKSIDLVVTDPPYLIDTDPQHLQNRSTNVGKSFLKSLPKLSAFSSSLDIPRFYQTLKRLQPKINAYIFANKAQIPTYIKTFVEEGKCAFEILLWYKPNSIPAYKHHYLPDKEYLLLFKEKGAYLNPTSKTNATTIFTAPMTAKERIKYNHPTVKPIELIKRAIINSSNEGDTILDPFAGTGTTSIAAHSLNRNSVNIEINPDYYSTMKTRFTNEALSDNANPQAQTA